MKTKINLIHLMYAASDYMYAVNDFKRKHDKFNGKRPYYYRENEDLTYLYNQMEKYSDVLQTASMVTGIPAEVIVNAVRIERKYEEKHKYQVCFFKDSLGFEWEDPNRERLIEVLMHRSPEDLCGIYNNEYFEAANRRLESKRAYRNKLAWWAEYERSKK